MLLKSPIEIAKKYFELSNQGDLNAIKILIDPNATYSSENTGLHFGKINIMTMKENFFSQYDHLFWQIHKIEEVKHNITLFDFTLEMKKNAHTEYRKGIEYVIVNDNQLIQHIEVKNKA